MSIHHLQPPPINTSPSWPERFHNTFKTEKPQAVYFSEPNIFFVFTSTEKVRRIGAKLFRTQRIITGINELAPQLHILGLPITGEGRKIENPHDFIQHYHPEDNNRFKLIYQQMSHLNKPW